MPAMPVDGLTLVASFCSTIGAVIISQSWERLMERKNKHRENSRKSWIRRKWSRRKKSIRRKQSSASLPDPIIRRGRNSFASEHIYGPGFKAPWARSNLQLPQEPERERVRHAVQQPSQSSQIFLHRADSTPAVLQSIPEEPSRRRRSSASTSSTSSIPQGDGSRDRVQRKRRNKLKRYEDVSEQLAELERMIMDDRIEALRWKMWQNRIDEMEERVVGLGHKAGTDGAPLRKAASIGPGPVTQRHEEAIQSLRDAAATAAMQDLSALRHESTLENRPPAVEVVPPSRDVR